MDKQTIMLWILLFSLQALEKGAQGSNAKFTYSCDGHSKSERLIGAF